MIPEIDSRPTYEVEVIVRYKVKIPEGYTLTGQEKIFSDNTRLVNSHNGLISDNMEVTYESLRQGH